MSIRQYWSLQINLEIYFILFIKHLVNKIDTSLARYGKENEVVYIYLAMKLDIQSKRNIQKKWNLQITFWTITQLT